MTTTTPNMNLILPDVSVTAGPQWATLLNAAYALIDSHDHSSGKGPLVTPAGLNISSDLTFAQNNATNLRTVRLFPNGSFTPISADKTCLYAVGGELHYIDASGNDVQLTLNGSVDVSGSISALSLNDSSFFLQYFGDATRQFRFNASAIPTATTRILSVPDSGANDTFVTQNATQTLTNKTLTTPAISAINTGSVTFTLPAADGTGGQVLQTNGSAVLSFVNAATTVANVAANDSNITFIASNNHVQVCNPTAARTYTLPTTGISVGDTWTFYNRSTTAANIITLQSSGGNTVDYVLPNGATTVVALTSTPTTASDWRCIDAYASGVAYTPTYTGLGTVTNSVAYYSRRGSKMSITAFVTTGTVNGSLVKSAFPNGFTATPSFYSTVTPNFVGSAIIAGTSSNQAQMLVYGSAPDYTGLFLSLQGGSQSGLTPLAGNAAFASGQSFSYVAEVNIAGWGG